MIDKKIMEPDLPKLKVITDDGAVNLINGIIRQAESDYVSAIVRYNTEKGRGKKTIHRQEIINCERFFRRDMETYTYCELDGDKVIEALRERARVRLKKKGNQDGGAEVLTVEELFSIQRDENRLRSLYIKLAEHEDFNPYKGNVITDMPAGGGGKNFLEWYVEEKERLENEIESCRKVLEEDKAKVNAYINAAPYPECEIIRFRVLNGMSWEEIGAFVGYSRQQAAKRFWDYIKDKRNRQDAHCKV